LAPDVETANVGPENQLLTRSNAVANAEADEGINPIDVTAPRKLRGCAETTKPLRSSVPVKPNLMSTSWRQYLAPARRSRAV
jgi:hypothetical protein